MWKRIVLNDIVSILNSVCAMHDPCILKLSLNIKCYERVRSRKAQINIFVGGPRTKLYYSIEVEIPCFSGKTSIHSVGGGD